jgi:hypothetical protein
MALTFFALVKREEMYPQGARREFYIPYVHPSSN